MPLNTFNEILIFSYANNNFIKNPNLLHYAHNSLFQKNPKKF